MNAVAAARLCVERSQTHDLHQAALEGHFEVGLAEGPETK